MSRSSTGRTRPRQREIVGPGVAPELLFNGGRVLTEGVAAAPDGTIYFSDITSTAMCTDERGTEAGHIWHYFPSTGACTIYRSPSGMANGIVFDARGRMVVAEGADQGGRRISRTDMDTGRSFVLASSFGGAALNSPNDVAVDARGAIYFTDPRYVGCEPTEQPVMGVYRLGVGGRLDRIVTDMRKPNGVAVSLDQSRLYVSESDNGSTFAGAMPPGSPLPDGAWRIYAYELQADEHVGPRKLFAELAGIGQPDGMTVDCTGNLYVAIARPDPMVTVWSPEGEWLAGIELPEPATNVEFGRGAEIQLLYITAGRSLYRIALRTEGFHLPADTASKEEQ